MSAAAPALRFLVRHPAHFIALGFGAGLSPVAPGTFGTLVAIPLAAVLRAYASGRRVPGRDRRASRVVGVWAAGVTGRALGVPDHGSIVIDEVVAFLLVLWFVGDEPLRDRLRVPALPPLRHREAAADPPARRRAQERRRRDAGRPPRGRLHAARARARAAVAPDAWHARPASTRRIEEAGLNALQTQRQLFYDGWLLRLSAGKAKRARSVNAHFGSTLPLDRKIAYCETRLRAARAAAALPDDALRPPGRTRGRARARAATSRSRRRSCRRAALERAPEVPTAAMTSRSTPLGATRSSTRSARSARFLGRSSATRIASASRIRRSSKRCIAVRAGGRVVCTAQVAIEGDLAGLYDVVTAEAARGQRLCDARLHVAPVVGVAARRARRVSAGQRGQCAGARDLSQARLRDGVHVSLPRPAGRACE